MFTVVIRTEESDEKLFENPGKIVEDGGEILFAKIGTKIVGTCALIKKSNDTYELGKMAVDEAYQGKSIGRKLLEYSIDFLRMRGAKTLTLETNRRLKAAVRLYERLGFVIDTDAPPSYYSRVDLTMKLDLTQPTVEALPSSTKQKVRSAK
ncbi:MAG: GNAT family N-acetyltransferase [Candidatus Melainabacteria bacterium]|nr:GNAT family N-acetyltransferase [Candidatus Melainabacteria bacterium]